jgi:anti-sigma regulatory factor (Ser/Thr protein kinase)
MANAILGGITMELWEKITTVYSELAENDFAAFGPEGTIRLQDDADGLGAYIAKWDYPKPIPDGLKLGK